jgi:hypothetical protein
MFSRHALWGGEFQILYHLTKKQGNMAPVPAKFLC